MGIQGCPAPWVDGEGLFFFTNPAFRKMLRILLVRALAPAWLYMCSPSYFPILMLRPCSLLVWSLVNLLALVLPSQSSPVCRPTNIFWAISDIFLAL